MPPDAGRGGRAAAEAAAAARLNRPRDAKERLRDWGTDHIKAQTLAHLVLAADGYTNIDPGQQNGGADRGRDGLATKDGVEYSVAVHFHVSSGNAALSRTKFTADLEKARDHGRGGMVFVTNKEISNGQVDELRSLADEVAPGVKIEIYHCDRLAHILNRPGNHGTRQEYLGIPMPAPLELGDGTADQRRAVALRDALAALRRSMLAANRAVADLNTSDLQLHEQLVSLQDVRESAAAAKRDAWDKRCARMLKAYAEQASYTECAAAANSAAGAVLDDGPASMLKTARRVRKTVSSLAGSNPDEAIHYRSRPDVPTVADQLDQHLITERFTDDDLADIAKLHGKAQAAVNKLRAAHETSHSGE